MKALPVFAGEIQIMVNGRARVTAKTSFLARRALSVGYNSGCTLSADGERALCSVVVIPARLSWSMMARIVLGSTSEQAKTLKI